MRVAPRNVINVSNFCDKIFRGFRSTGVKVQDLPLTLLVIVTTVLRYRAACDGFLQDEFGMLSRRAGFSATAELSCFSRRTGSVQSMRLMRHVSTLKL